MEWIVAGMSYIVLVIGYLAGISNIILLCGRDDAGGGNRPARKVRVVLLSLCDMVFLGRLFRINRALWIGEWLFHVSFVLVAAGHLRYILDPVPGWVSPLVRAGRWAGYVLPVAIVYIVGVRISLGRRGDYLSRSNLMVMMVIFCIAVTGVAMRLVMRPDIIGVKYFVIGLLALRPVPLPDSAVFMFHYGLFLLLLLYLPSHVLAAPRVMMQARRREESFRPLGYEE